MRKYTDKSIKKKKKIVNKIKEKNRETKKKKFFYGFIRRYLSAFLLIADQPACVQYAF